MIKTNPGPTGPKPIVMGMTGYGGLTKPQGIKGSTGPQCPVGPVGATGPQGPPPGKYVIFGTHLEIRDEKIARLHIAWSYINFTNLLFDTPISSSSYKYMDLTDESNLKLNMLNLTQINIPFPLHEEVDKILKIIFDENEFLNIENVKAKINKTNENFAIISLRNIMRTFNINKKMSLEQALNTTKEHFIESIHEL